MSAAQKRDLDSTVALRQRLAEHQEFLSKERGSVPPSAPRQIVELTSERRAEIAKALANNPTMLTLVPLIDLEPHISPAEFQAFVREKGVQK